MVTYLHVLDQPEIAYLVKIGLKSIINDTTRPVPFCFLRLLQCVGSPPLTPYSQNSHGIKFLHQQNTLFGRSCDYVGYMDGISSAIPG
jgi:hypothetical protein